MQDTPDQLQRMLDYYGLAQDPFGEQVNATVFSNAGDRTELAEQFKHLLTFSPQDCLLMAPAGGGKATLAHQVLKRLDEEWRVAWINALEAHQLDVLVRELIGQLGLGLKADGDIASAFRNIADVIRQRTEDGEYFLLIVQHADQLATDVQQWLLSLRSLSPRPDCRLRQLWLASSATAIEQADSDEYWYALVLEPFSAADALTYLKDRFAGAGQLEGVPIEARDVSRLNELAGGLPGELNQVVRDYLVAGTFKSTERRQGFPLTHVLAGAAVVTVVVLTVLYSQQASQDSPAPSASSEVVEEVGQPSEVQQRLAEAAARIEARRQESQTSETELESPSEPSGSASNAELEFTDDPEILAGSDAQVATNAASSPEIESPPPQSSGEVQDSDSEPSDQAEALSLMEQASDKEYTLQLLGVRDRQAVERVLSGLDDANGYEIIDSTYQGEPWYVLIHGQYEDAAAARADISNLPPDFASQSPWPRTFASLRATVSGD